jgi:uncharacterized protein (DUF433 family)
MVNMQENAMKHERIEVNPKIMFGKPVIKGTRLTVQQIVEELEGGMSEAEILEAHPRLTREDIGAARKFAVEYMTHAAE